MFHLRKTSKNNIFMFKLCYLFLFVNKISILLNNDLTEMKKDQLFVKKGINLYYKALYGSRS